MLFFFFWTILMVSLDYEVYVMARFKFKVYLENKIKFIELEEYQNLTRNGYYLFRKRKLL